MMCRLVLNRSSSHPKVSEYMTHRHDKYLYVAILRGGGGEIYRCYENAPKQKPTTPPRKKTGK